MVIILPCFFTLDGFEINILIVAKADNSSDRGQFYEGESFEL